MKTIFNLYKDFRKVGGAEKVAIQLHSMFRSRFSNSLLMGNHSYDEVNSNYRIEKDEYQEFKLTNIFKLRGCIVLSHHRKNTSLLYLANKVLGLKIRLIHIAHNEFFNLRRVTFYPDEIIAVSQRVKDNLVSYFKIDQEKITVIHNGLPDNFNNIDVNGSKFPTKDDNVKILYGARITEVKGQLRLVNNLKGKLHKGIKIYFAGLGEDVPALKELIKDDVNFEYLGLIDFKDSLGKYDFCMLFSSNEGLPLSLIEACSFKLPIICNDVGGNTEIVEDKKNGFVVNSYDELVTLLNSGIPHPTTKEYQLLSECSRVVYERKFKENIMYRSYLKFLLKDEEY